MGQYTSSPPSAHGGYATKLSRRRTKCVFIRSHHAPIGQNLQSKPVVHGVEEAAAGHRPRVPLDAIRGGAELQELLPKLALQDVRDLDAKIIGGAAQQQPRRDAELPFSSDTTTIDKVAFWQRVCVPRLLFLRNARLETDVPKKCWIAVEP